jgi:two-component system sensor histidine kinase UhpB
MRLSLVPRIPAVIVCIFLSWSLHAQKTGTVPDSIQIDNLILQSAQLSQQAAWDSALSLGKRALQMARQQGYRHGEARACDRLAETLMQMGQMNEVHYYDSLVMPMARALNDTTLIVNADNRSGIYYMEKGKIKEGHERFIHALEIKLEKAQSIKTAEVYSNLASLFMAVGNKDKAMEWFFKSLRLYELHNSETGQGETYSNISSVYYLMGKVDDAIEYQKKSIYFRERQNDLPGLVNTQTNIGQLYILKDSFNRAIHYLQRAVNTAEQLKSPKLMGTAYSGIASYYSRSKDYKAALSWQSKAIAIFEKADNKPMLSRLYVAAGLTANAANDSLAAINYYNKALDISRQLANKENISNAYSKLASFYLGRSQYKDAYENYQKHITYRDSIKDLSTLTRIEEIRGQYETEKKDNEINQLKTQERIRQLEIEKQKAIIAGNKLAAKQTEDEIQLLSQQQELRDSRIQQQEKELEKQIMLAKNTQQELLLAEQQKLIKDKQLLSQKQARNLIIAGVVLLGILGLVLFNRYQLKKKLQQQNELLSVRNNIAKDLHDEIGSTLTSIKILSEVSKNNLEKDHQKASSLLNKITEQSSQMQQGMSDIIWAIKPDNDRLENMLVRMREYASHTLESKDITAVFLVDEKVLSQSLDMEQRRDFFLIFKEAINNAAKYSQATRVDIRISRAGDRLLLKIADDGVGFLAGRQTSSNGLKNMKARAEAMHGTLEIRSEPGKGTTIFTEVPAT